VKKNITKFLISPEPFDDESIPGYVMRLSKENKYEASWVYSLLKRNPEVSLQNPDNDLIKKISSLTSVSESKIRKMLLTENINGNGTIPKKYIHYNKRKLCPKCLLESTYHRKIWDFVFFAACPKHYCILIDKCPGCKKGLKFQGSELKFCNCNWDLTKTEAILSTEEDISLSKYIYNKFYGYKDQMFDKNNPFSTINLFDLFKVIDLLVRKMYTSPNKVLSLKSISNQEIIIYKEMMSLIGQHTIKAPQWIPQALYMLAEEATNHNNPDSYLIRGTNTFIKEEVVNDVIRKLNEYRKQIQSTAFHPDRSGEKTTVTSSK
jgi:hypothetical protein